MATIKGRKGDRPSIEVLGLHGSFKVPNQHIQVKYVSTFAGKREPQSGNAQLLSELKPMRERIDADELNDLGALLQRDLNDARVAKELVPYLLGRNREVSFFPAILAVLIPRGFIQGKESEYPVPKVDGDTVSFGEHWEYEKFRLEGGESSPFGKLKIYNQSTDVLVLDGQHRSSAFRFVAGDLEQDEEDIYSAFYGERDINDDFKADLPVTIIWFENSGTVDPKLVSRRLFVDVNNTAREVSKSRNILLDDRVAPALLTRFLFSRIASDKPYRPDKLSLLHAAFDIDSELTNDVGHSISLTNPEYVFDFMSWMFFGSTYFDSEDSYQIHRSDKRSRTYVYVFGEEFSNGFNDKELKIIREEDDPKVVIKDTSKIDNFETDFNARVGSVFEDVFNKFTLFSSHFAAAENTQERFSENATEGEYKIWSQVFTGGEGLYYTFMHESSSTQSVERYRKQIEKIEEHFKNNRAKMFNADRKKVDQAFISVRTKAFQIGLFMALREFKKQLDYKKYSECVDLFITKVNQIGSESWVSIFNKLRPKLVNGTDPKQWPAYQKLVLRIALHNTDNPFYTSENLKYSPEGKILREQLIERLKGWAETEGLIYSQLTKENVEQVELSSWVREEVHETKQLFSDCGISPIDGDYMEVGLTALDQELND